MKLNQLKSVLKGVFAGVAAAFGLSVGAAELPAGYTAVDYIVAPNGAYIDTGYEPNQNTHVVMDVTVQGALEYWFGCWTNDYNRGAFALGNDGEYGIYYAIGDDGDSFKKVDGGQDGRVPDGRQTVEVTPWEFKVNAVTWAEKEESSRKDIHLDEPLYLFAQNRKGKSFVNAAQGDIICHGCTIYEGEAVKRDFVPCVRMSDGAGGLYDLAATGSDKVFYANVGTGTFGIPAVTYCTVTIGDYQHMTAAWTSGDGSETNAISGTSFDVPIGTINAKVIFMPEDRYALDKTEIALDSPLVDDCALAAEDLPTATYRYAKVTVGELPAHVASAAWTSGDGSETNAISGGVFEVPKGTEKVKVIFTADPAYEVVEGKLVHDIGTVKEDCAPEFGDLPQLVHRKVEYVDADGQLRTNDTFTVVTAKTAQLSNGWYLVEGMVSRGGIDVVSNCAANLILADGASLTVQGAFYHAGIDVCSGETLNIFGQRDGTGRLAATGNRGAGIGGGEGGSGGTVTVNGGVVTANGGSDGAGIGGGWNGTGGTVTVNGGVVTANGGDDGAGIGGGWGRVGGTVTVNGGVVTATGGNNGAGIGGGGGGAGYKVTVNGGAVTATGGNDGAGIGGGQTGNGGTVTVNGGVVTATGGNDGAGIGGGRTGNGGKVTVEGGTVTATGNGGGAGIGGGYSGEDGKVELYKAKVRVVEGAYGNGSAYVMIADRDYWEIVTVGELPAHVASAVWTSVDGMTTNEIYGTGFAVPKGAENVKVIYTADSGYSFADGAVAAEVLVGRVDADCTVTAPEVRMSEIEAFGRGWYVTAPCGAYIDTYSKPDSNTRVEMEVLVGDISSKREYWFGCWTNSWNNGVFALGNDGAEVYCGYGSGDDTCGGINGLGPIPSGRVTVALEKGIVYTNCVVWSAAHESDAKFSLDRNLYLFAQNRAGTAKPGDGQERIVCYGCRISTNGVNGAAVPVRNFVPARTKDERQFVGLYDTVSGEFFAARGGMLTLEYDEDFVNYAVVTVGELPEHVVSAAWTSGDGSVTNAISGAFFDVRKGSENVKVIFTSAPGYSFAEGVVTAEVSLGDVSDDCAVTASEVRKSEIETFGLDWYVAATDGAYIDTGLMARGNTKIDADMQALRLTAQCGFFGTIGGGMNLAAYINGWNPGQFATCLGKDADYTASGVPADTERHRFVLDANKPGSFAIDGTNVTCLTDNVTADSKSKYPILIGARNQDGTAMPMNCRIFSFKIYEGEILLRDFVPARTKDDGRIVGLYDTVSGEFFAARGGMLTLGYYDDPSRYAMVTVGELPEHVVSAAWTGGDGSETNAISDIFFRVLKGTENVKVIFTADPAYEVVEGKLVHDIGTVSEDCAPEFGNLPQFVHRRVGYVDENGRLLTNDTFTVVTELTDKFSNGWYLVEGTVTRGGIDLSENCTANLILADGASLTVTAADNGAGIDVRQGETLNIYGQRDGSGRLTATGGSSGVGIGGGEGGAGGKVTISGGWVWAEGQNAFGGDITIRGEMAAFDVTDGEPGTMIVEADELTSVGKILVASSLRRVTVPAVENTTVSVATNGVPVEGFAGGDLDIPLRVKVTVDYTAVEGWWVFGTAHFETTVSGEVRLPAEGDEPTAFRLGYMAVEYVDEDGCLQTNETARIVTADTDTLESGWHVVTGAVSRGGIDVASGCTANLILADGASLTAQGVNNGAGINVSLGETLNIYGQRGGTGWLAATGGQHGAGIGGGYMGDNGTVTINGGTVSAQGGQWSAGIGGGYGGAGGTVTVNGGTVTAIGNDGGKGIGGGRGEGGGKVTINGGTIVADGWNGQGLGEQVKIDGGSIKTKSMSEPPKNSDSAAVYCVTVMVESVQGPVVLTGLPAGYGTRDVAPIEGKLYLYLPNGDYAFEVNGARFAASVNGAATMAIRRFTVTVTLAGGLPEHVTAAWTSGDWSETNTISGASFEVPIGTINAKVIFTPEERYALDKTEVALDSPLTDDYTLTEDDLPKATCIYAKVTVGEIPAHVTAAWTSGDGSETNAISGTSFDVPIGTINAKVIFMPEDRYALDKTEIALDSPLVDDCALAAEDLPTATYRYAKVTVGELPAHVASVAWTSGDGSETNAISGGVFEVLKGMENVKVIFTADPAYEVVGGKLVHDIGTVNEDYELDFGSLPQLVHRKVEYFDVDGQLRTNDTFTIVTEATAKLENGWYLVEGTVSRGGIDLSANCTAYLILADGASLTVQGADRCAGIDVRQGATLNIYGQRNGTGRLTAKGGNWGAGIGGGYYGAGGTVTINGGTVTAKGGKWGAGIGGCLGCDGGEVTINGGAVRVVAGADAAVIGRGYNGNGDGTVTITGGIFAMEVNDAWYDRGRYVVFSNPDEETRGDYPFAVMWGVAVTVGEHPHMTAAWTSGDGSKTNAIGGAVFAVLKGTENVKVIFTADPAYEVVEGMLVHAIGTVNEDCALEFGDLPQLVHRKVEYVDADGELRTNDTFMVVTAETAPFSNGWYLVEGMVSRGGIDVAANCTANLILVDGASLMVQGAKNCAGIDVQPGETLNIYGQHGGSGQLTATGGEYGAGIGGGFNGTGGTVTINGGTVMATGGNDGAGIGGGCRGAGGTVTINDGMVTATGGYDGAGIGGGYGGAGGTVTINGGTVTATGGYDGVGIGGGDYSDDDGFVEFGAEVAGGVLTDCGVMMLDAYAADHSAKSVTLPVAVVVIPQVNGLVYAVSNGTEAVTGIGLAGRNTYVVATGDTLRVYFSLVPGCTYTTEPQDNPMEVSVSDWFTAIEDKDLPQVSVPTVEYLDWDGKELVKKSATDYTFVMSEMSAFEAGKTYVVAGEVVRQGGVVVDGTPDAPTCLILCDGAKLTVTGTSERHAAILVAAGGATTNALVICGQAAGTGELVVSNLASYAAAIGGDSRDNGTDTADCGTVTINGGMVTATGGMLCAGIGGGYYGAGGTVTINGGMVTATGGMLGAGIGGGEYGAGGTVTINGGMVTATGGILGAGIGGGDRGADGTVTLDVTKVVVVEGAYGNGYSYVKIVEKPTCEGGTIEWSDAAKAWVVAPNADVTEVTITGLPEGASVAVKCGDYAVPSAAFVGFGEDGKTFSLALDENGAVTIGDDEIPVRPTIGDLDDDATKPFVVGEGGAAVTVRTIPGLKYELKRATDLGADFGAIGDGVTAVGDGTPVTLTDGEPPADKAFYRVEVSVP